MYRTTPVNIVTESLYEEPVGIITEKTLFAFASLQLPILVAHKGAVKDAESYGFDMFTDIIDHSYDNLPNDVRWKSAIDLNMHILNGKFNYDDLLPRLKKNQEYIMETRKEVGSDYRLMVDCYMALDVPYAIDLANAVREANLFWIEE